MAPKDIELRRSDQRLASIIAYGRPVQSLLKLALELAIGRRIARDGTNNHAKGFDAILL